MNLKFTASAKRQFLNGLAFIRRDKPSAARKFREKAEATLLRLSEFPESGRSIPEFPDLAYCEVIVRPYRFFYRTEGTTVWIVAVWHSAQLPNEPENSGA